MWGWVVGSAANIASSTPIELGLGLILATIPTINKYPHLLKGTVLGDKEQGVGMRDKSCFVIYRIKSAIASRNFKTKYTTYTHRSLGPKLRTTQAL